ncbi:hypothetical protein PVAP13_8KG110802 [Panicum virgatum]|uniref:Sulfotransferase n=1 Tax=Panicum virgatum TaxID=38727 RepID=A0A8T0PGA2_PANVG|nr:hypothetical protein PVAP13_8KG110802 [Panicum virgatum]
MGFYLIGTLVTLIPLGSISSWAFKPYCDDELLGISPTDGPGAPARHRQPAGGVRAARVPRVLATHLPYCLLPESITAGEGAAASRVVYVCRNPKDAFISGLFFVKKVSSAYGAGASAGARAFNLEEAFELFCEGRVFAGPQWRHVLQDWEASMRRPKQVLFLEYERMLRDPEATVKKLAEFMGCGFSKEEEEGWVVDEIVKLCSLKELKNMEVNRSGGNQAGVRNDAYFLKGSSGDWRNHLTPEMAKKLDKIVEEALQGSGFAFVDDGI